MERVIATTHFVHTMLGTVNRNRPLSVSSAFADQLVEAGLVRRDPFQKPVCQDAPVEGGGPAAASSLSPVVHPSRQTTAQPLQGGKATPDGSSSSTTATGSSQPQTSSTHVTRSGGTTIEQKSAHSKASAGRKTQPQPRGTRGSAASSRAT